MDSLFDDFGGYYSVLVIHTSTYDGMKRDSHYATPPCGYGC